ncbi:MAG: S1 RNA-binding domain-containing protein, partial [Candidatus ainarchaeum sp.]|nr:S1 RNA-binding domain-containing protein [Candidatus ainarchaeum sp.]
MDFPERDEILIAVVKKVMPYGAFCEIPEYKIESFMHISQVSSGWVKNIHEFISEGQTLVVKVCHIDPEKNQVDISLKSVTEDEKRKKLDSIKRAKRGEKLLEIALNNSKLKKVKIEEYIAKIEEKYDDVFSCFEECFKEGESALEGIDFPEKLKSEILSVAKLNIKKSQAIISGVLSLSCPTANGLDSIKDVLLVDNPNFSSSYLGAPNYKLTFI